MKSLSQHINESFLITESEDENKKLLKVESSKALKIFSLYDFSIKKSEKFKEDVRSDIFKANVDSKKFDDLIRDFKKNDFKSVHLSKLDLIISSPSENVINAASDNFSLSSIKYDSYTGYSSNNIALVKLLDDKLISIVLTYAKLTKQQKKNDFSRIEQEYYCWANSIQLVAYSENEKSFYTNSLFSSAKANNVSSINKYKY